MAEKTIDQLEYIALPENLSTVRMPVNINGQTVRTNIEDLVAKIKAQTFSRNIGEIVPSILPLNDAMLHLMDGGIISSIGVYSAFATYLNTFVVEYPNLFCDEATWQSINTTYGQCAKFVIDDEADTIRLPKITEYIKGVSSLSELGTVLGAGLPNITGDFNPGGIGVTANGAFTVSATVRASNDGQASDSKTVTFNASNSNAIYGNSDTVTPNTAKATLYLVLGNIVKTDIVVDIDQVITDLNGKADVNLNNISANIDYVIESYSSGTEWYKKYKSGWIEQGGKATLPDGWTITFLVPFTNTNYSVLSEPLGMDTVGSLGITSQTTTTMSGNIVGVGGGTLFWKAYGY